MKKGYSEESIGVNKVSGTKQERGNGRGLSEVCEKFVTTMILLEGLYATYRGGLEGNEGGA